MQALEKHLVTMIHPSMLSIRFMNVGQWSVMILSVHWCYNRHVLHRLQFSLVGSAHSPCSFVRDVDSSVRLIIPACCRMARANPGMPPVAIRHMLCLLHPHGLNSSAQIKAVKWCGNACHTKPSYNRSLPVLQT